MPTGLDYSRGTILGAAILAGGHSFVVRYIDDPTMGLGRKHITPAEYKELCAAGVDVWLVMEIDTNDTFGGFASGADKARRARAGADWIGYPSGRIIFFCADRHLNPDQVQVGLGYLDGAASVLGRAAVGCYGFWEFVDAAIAGNHAAAYWQCGIAPASSDPVHLWQRNDRYTTVGGIQCDVNELLRPMPVEPATHPAGAAPPWRLPPKNYYGLRSGPAESHGGADSAERDAVTRIQRALIRRGYVPDVTDPSSRWADGKYEQDTADAVERFQRREKATTTEFYGRVYSDDWAVLLRAGS